MNVNNNNNNNVNNYSVMMKKDGKIANVVKETNRNEDFEEETP